MGRVIRDEKNERTFSFTSGDCGCCSNFRTLDFKSKDVTTVAEARVSGADTKAVVKGHIVRKINDNKYVFQDKTGEIIIDLSPKAGSLPVDANAEIEIEGRVEQDLVFAGIEARKYPLSTKRTSQE